MPVSPLEFGATVDRWVRMTNRRMEAVFKESTKRVISEAQRVIPIDTGYARASLQVSTASMPQIDSASRPPPDAGRNSFAAPDISTVIVGAQLGDTIYAGWTASYVIFLEYGHSQQAPSGFVRLAAMQWRTIVEEVTAEAKQRAGGE